MIEAAELYSQRQHTVRFSTDICRDVVDASDAANVISSQRGQFSVAHRLLSRFTDQKSIESSVELSIVSEASQGSHSTEKGVQHITESAFRDDQGTARSHLLVDNVATSSTRSSTRITRLYSFWGSNLPTLFWQSAVVIASREQWRKQVKTFKATILNVREYQADPLGRTITIDAREDVAQFERISQSPYIGNHVTTSRYTIYNFLPRQLAFQFSKVANIYFLTISILQMIPGLSTTGTYTTIVPLAIFILIAMAREGYDDLRRHRMDTVENHMKITTIQASAEDEYEYTSKNWGQLKVGDIVKLEKDDWVPADLVLLRSEQLHGVAYLETAALDGETSLKTKRAIPSIADHCSAPRLYSFLASIHSEAPNKNLYHYEGKLTHNGIDIPITNDQVLYRGSIVRDTSALLALVIFTGEETKIRLNASAHVRIKRPRMQGRVNRVVLTIVAFVIGLSIFCTCAYYIWHSRTEARLWYLDAADLISFLPIFISFLILYNTMVPLSLYVAMEIVKAIQQVLLQQDIDLYHEDTDTPAEARTSTINEELGQITHIFSDKTGTLTDNMMVFRRLSVAGHSWFHDIDIKRHAATDRPFLLHKVRKPKGNIKRSATMDVKCSDAEEIFRLRSSTGDLGARRASIRTSQRQSTTSWMHPPAPNQAIETYTTTEMLFYIQQHPHTVFARRARLSLLAIALCHTVLPSGDISTEEVQFSAASPDEVALVTAAKELGYMLIDRGAHTVTLRTFPSGIHQAHVDETFLVHEILEFSSTRKRMSVVIEFPDGRICLLCKGADSVLLDRLRLKSLAKKKWSEVQVNVNLRRSMDAERALARKSLARPSVSRPSMSGSSRLDTIRHLDEFLDQRKTSKPPIEEHANTHKDMHRTLRHSIAIGEASVPLERTSAPIVDESLASSESAILQETFQHLEGFASEGLRVLLYGHRFLKTEDYMHWKSLYHVASTSFSDRQRKIDEVAELIEVDLDLTSATAIEDKLQDGVPQSIEKLGRAGMKIWMLTGDKRETAINIGHSAGLIKDYSRILVLDQHEAELVVILDAYVLEIASGQVAHAVIVIDGVTLDFIEHDPILMSLFMKLAVTADAVICCRASPAQKATLVRHVRKEVATSVTLAIGDGANDIAMIREAHVGIGITGKEGLQAARSSDYSIAQFRFLVKLLLVHGRWHYIRISKYVLGTFYKEMLLFLTQAIYQRFAGYTGTSLHESWSLSLFNTLFTSLAVICLGSFEKDLSAATLLAVPELYETSRSGQAFNVKILLGWLVLAATQAVSSFYLAYFAYGRPESPTLYPLGDMVFTALVVVINVKLIFIEMHSWSIINYSFFLISFGGWWLWSTLQAEVYKSSKAYFVKDAFINEFGRDLSWWSSLFLITSSLLLMDIGGQALRSVFLPTEEDCFRELQTDAALKARLEEEAALELQSGWINDLLEKRTQLESTASEPQNTNLGASTRH